MRGEKGQVLLLIVLLSATLLAIAGGIFFESLVQTQVTKIQEESIRNIVWFMLLKMKLLLF